MGIDPVMTIRVLLDPCQNWDESWRSSLIGIHFQAPEFSQDLSHFSFNSERHPETMAGTEKIQQKTGASFVF
jgi:hypothetical protein